MDEYHQRFLSLGINFTSQHLFIENGSGVLIKNGGKLEQQ